MKYFRLIRIHQWVKNAFIFIPAFFGGGLFDSTIMLRLILGFFAFSLVASAIYIVNDIKDLDFDRQHPKKSKRPLASGEIPIPSGLAVMAVLLLLGFSLAFWIDKKFALILAAYFSINLAYCFGLKKIAIVDITTIAIGFFLRVVSGGVVGDITISKWLVIMTFLLALFLGFAKRRDDIVLFMESGNRMREALHGYNLEFINSVMSLMAGVILVSYIMYTVSDEVVGRLGENIYLSTFFVLTGVLRYMQVTLVYNNSGSPTKILLKDRFIQIALLGWVAFFFATIYYGAR